MTDTLTELDPEQLRRELIRLFAEPKSLHHIVAAGLDGVRRQLADLSEAIGTAENGADQVVDTVAQLANLVRQEQRKHAGAVAQAKKEHARANALQLSNEDLLAAGRDLLNRLVKAKAENGRLRGELADYQLAASEHEGAAVRALCGATIGSLGTVKPIGPCIRPAGHPGDQHEAADGAKWEPLAMQPLFPQQREPVGGDRVRVVVEGDLVIDPRGFREYTLAFRPGPNGTQIGYFRLPPSATVTVLGTNPAPVAPCWCGHDPEAHVTDDSDNAVCRECAADLTVPVQRVLHVHAPEQP